MLQRQVMTPKECAAYPSKVPVRDWLRTIPWTAAEAIHEPATPTDHGIRSDALKWIAEVLTMYWVRDENFSREVAPASDSVALQYVHQIKILDEADRVHNLEATASSRTKSAKRAVRKWSARFLEGDAEQIRSAGWRAWRSLGCTSWGLICIGHLVRSMDRKRFLIGVVGCSEDHLCTIPPVSCGSQKRDRIPVPACKPGLGNLIEKLIGARKTVPYLGPKIGTILGSRIAMLRPMIS